MDLAKRAALLSKIKPKWPTVGGGPGPTVPLQDFFDGNDDIGSIGCNLLDSPGPQRFYEVFQQIQSRPDVQGVYVQISDLMDEEGSWPFSDTVFVLGAIPTSELKRIVNELQPDEVGQFPPESIPQDLPVLQPGMTVLGAWWD